MRLTPGDTNRELTRATRAVVLAQALSAAGDAVLEIAAFWHTAQHSDSAILVGALAVTIGVSALVGGVLGGVLVDRVSRSRLMPWIDFVRAGVLVAGIGALIVLGPEPWSLFPVVLVVSAGNAVYLPASRALVAELTPTESLSRVNSRLQSWSGAAAIAGYGAGALVIAGVGVEAALGLDAVTFIAAGLLIRFRVPRREGDITSTAGPSPRRSASQSLRRLVDDIASGLRAISSNRTVRALLVVSTLAVSLLAPIDPLSPVLVQEVMMASVGMLAVIETAVMLGRISGSVLARWIPSERPLLILAVTLAMIGFGALGVSVLPTPIIVPMGYLVMGIGAGISAVVVMTGLQQGLDGRLHGRVFGLQRALFEAVPPLTIFGLTAVADTYGPLTSYGVIAVGLITMSLLTFVAISRPPVESEGTR